MYDADCWPSPPTWGGAAVLLGKSATQRCRCKCNFQATKCNCPSVALSCPSVLGPSNDCDWLGPACLRAASCGSRVQPGTLSHSRQEAPLCKYPPPPPPPPKQSHASCMLHISSMLDWAVESNETENPKPKTRQQHKHACHAGDPDCPLLNATTATI